ncbi:hypothetical protein EYZ11_003087 [Aspergillus tanneri]|uniref:Uncharacterized protein n=1 Tax=Aspergillus tanneri TaxID=1220188 RepID=A0A4S3JRA6_9EURO|nr:hypothetical protein EYZ11_003087 [Aspergillus tanneri]
MSHSIASEDSGNVPHISDTPIGLVPQTSGSRSVVTASDLENAMEPNGHGLVGNSSPGLALDFPQPAAHAHDNQNRIVFGNLAVNSQPIIPRPYELPPDVSLTVNNEASRNMLAPFRGPPNVPDGEQSRNAHVLVQWPSASPTSHATALPAMNEDPLHSYPHHMAHQHLAYIHMVHQHAAAQEQAYRHAVQQQTAQLHMAQNHVSHQHLALGFTYPMPNVQPHGAMGPQFQIVAQPPTLDQLVPPGPSRVATGAVNLEQSTTRLRSPFNAPSATAVHQRRIRAMTNGRGGHTPGPHADFRSGVNAQTRNQPPNVSLPTGAGSGPSNPIQNDVAAATRSMLNGPHQGLPNHLEDPRAAGTPPNLANTNPPRRPESPQGLDRMEGRPESKENEDLTLSMESLSDRR